MNRLYALLTLATTTATIGCAGDEPREASVESAATVSTASNISFNNQTSGLQGRNVQSALDEVAARSLIPGPQGVEGPAGPAGPQGPTGPAGPQGTTGPQGLAGRDGQSVTSLPLIFGDAVCAFGGTQFTTASGITYACSGAPGAVGPQGVPGEAGAQGPQGATGAKGDAGPAGPQGVRGVAGLSSTQVAPSDWIGYSQGHFYGIIRDQMGLGTGVWRTDQTSWLLTKVLDTTKARYFDAALSGPFDRAGAEKLVLFSERFNEALTVDVATNSLSSVTVYGAHDLAPAGLGPDGGAGGYTGDVRTLFTLVTDLSSADFIGRTYLAYFDRSMSGSAHNVVDLSALIASAGLFPRCVRLEGLAHDPGDRRIYVGDPCNGVIWILAYTQARGPLNIAGTINPPALGKLAYDAEHDLLWTGTHGIPAP
jgi:hypothetical protein